MTSMSGKKTPIQQLNISDRAALTNFINYQSIGGNLDIDKIFRYWDKNKRKLYKMLGYKLRRTFPIHIEPDNNFILLSELPNLYNNPVIGNYGADSDKYFQRWIDKEKNLFIKTVFQHILNLYNNKSIIWHAVYSFVTMFKHYAITCQYTQTEYYFEYKNKNKKLKIDRKTKIMRAIRKTLEFFEYPYMDLFETWRDKISVALSLKNIDTKVTLSIHPIDLISLSDNNSNWHSCLAWGIDGNYKYGTLEMLNSNMALVAYIENTKHDYEFYGKKVPNKVWRSLFFIDKNIILAGKDYPFNNHYLQEQVMDILIKLTKENLGYTYQYQKQDYYDVMHYNNNEECIEYMYDFCNTDNHKIITYMNDFMYNDFIDNDWTALCCRNYVDKTKFINLSGPITCLSCGDPVSYENIANDRLWCNKCNHNYCLNCDRNNNAHNHYYIEMVDKFGFHHLAVRCEECLITDYWYLETDSAFILKKDYLFLRGKDEQFTTPEALAVTKELLEVKGF